MKAADVYRRLRNCFAHVNWSYVEANISKADLAIRLQDFWVVKKKNKKVAQETFDATIDLVDLLDLAEKLLITTFNGMA